MLEREVVGSSSVRRQALGVVVSAAAVAAGYALWARPAALPPRVLVVPAPPVVVERVERIERVERVEPPAPAPPPPPAPPPAAPVVAPHCAANVDTVGVPLTQAMLDETPREALDLMASTFVIDEAGCAIAIVQPDALVVTWDGGQRFTRYATGGRLQQVALAGNRAMMLRDNALGVLHAGDVEITWRDLGALAVPAVPANDKLNDDERRYGSYLHLAAAGSWTAVLRTHSEPFEPTTAHLVDRLLGFSEDDGATWRYMTPPEAGTVDITDDGRLWLTRMEWLGGGDGEPGTRTYLHLASDLAHTRWLTGAQLPARRGAAPYHYEFDQDRSWGCGGTQKLVAYRRERAVDTLVSDLNPMNDPIGLAQNAVAAYAIYGEQLHRLRGTRSTPISETYIQDLVGVDRYGTLIANRGPLLLRWSERGGWRVLWSPAH